MEKPANMGFPLVLVIVTRKAIQPSMVYGVSQTKIDRLQRVQNVLARVVAQAPSTISSVHIRRDLH